MKTPLPCIVCQKTLKPVFENREEREYCQPKNANTFHTTGTYGSTVFDPLDGSIVIVNICDLCLVAANEEGKTQILADESGSC